LSTASAVCALVANCAYDSDETKFFQDGVDAQLSDYILLPQHFDMPHLKLNCLGLLGSEG